jgi:hypothetical protein
VSTTAPTIAGPLRSPRNSARDAGDGSIHDDATASRLGFKGGTVAGSIHMDQFAPLLISLFGEEEFFGRGNLSLFFLQPTVDLEPVRAMATREPGARQAQLSMENEQGDQIAIGTASCGEPDTDTEVRRRMEKLRRGGDLRILAGRAEGDEVEIAAHHIDSAAQRLDVITEPLAAYSGDGSWDGEVAPMSHIVHSIIGVQRELSEHRIDATGLYGALEIQFLDGPLFTGRDYTARGEIVALTESPKTENMWWTCTYSDPDTGSDVVSVLQYMRFMKGSSPLWSDQDG